MPKVVDLIQFLQENYAAGETIAYAVFGIEDVKSECGDFIPDDVCEKTLDNAQEYLHDMGLDELSASYDEIQN